MKSSILTILMCCCLLTACIDNDEIGDPTPILTDYILPQEGASDEVNQRIQNYYDKYGSYLIYRFTNTDAWWLLVSVLTNTSETYITTEGDPANVGPMLDFLEEAWLQYFPDDFLRKGGLPYRVFLCDSIYSRREFANGKVSISTYDITINGNAFLFGNLNKIPTMTEASKKSLKELLFSTIWYYYRDNGIIDVPEAFYGECDYVNRPDMSDKGENYYGSNRWYYDDDQLAALRNRGFIPSYPNYGITSEIFYRSSTTNDAWSGKTVDQIQAIDYKAYISNILYASDAYMAEYLQYPLIKQKWDCLIDYYKETYGIDLRTFNK